MTIQRQFFPNDEDQTGAAKALLRLQDTYNLDTDTLSRGNLPGKGHRCYLQQRWEKCLDYKCPDYKSFHNLPPCLTVLCEGICTSLLVLELKISF